MNSERRLKRGERIVLASHNKGKLVEFRALLAPTSIEIVSAAELGLAEPEETADSFEGNAAIKALAAAKATGMPALSDDSGFCVSALDGRPGIYSARWAGPGGDMQVAMQRVHDEMGGSPDKQAAFVAVLCLAWPDGTTRFAEGRCEGTICWPPRGDHGHGYDPMFVPQGDCRSFAELSSDEKNATSHRGRALARFLETCVSTDPV